MMSMHVFQRWLKQAISESALPSRPESSNSSSCGADTIVKTPVSPVCGTSARFIICDYLHLGLYWAWLFQVWLEPDLAGFRNSNLALARFGDNLFLYQRTICLMKLMVSAMLSTAIKMQYSSVLPLLHHCLPVFDKICVVCAKVCRLHWRNAGSLRMQYHLTVHQHYWKTAAWRISRQLGRLSMITLSPDDACWPVGISLKCDLVCF